LHFPERPGAGREPRFTPILGDFRDPVISEQALEGVDAVIHLASAHLDTALPESEYWDVNVHSVPVFLERARAAGVQAFVHVSSVGIYGNLRQCPADEDTPCEPQSIYGRTKLEGERRALEFHRSTGFPVVVLRPAWVYGPGCPRTRKLYRALKRRKFVMIGAGRNLRHPVFIADFVSACRLALTAPDAAGAAYLIAGDSAVTSQELVDSFCRALELPKPRIRVPYSVIRPMVATAESLFGLVGKVPPITRRSLEFFDTDNAFDISRATRVLGFRPAFSLEQGLQLTKDWLDLGEADRN
ncbi:MAG: NAD-dependent epimerase/dehydratase family protein, partial [Acidobacteriota bacterium]